MKFLYKEEFWFISIFYDKSKINIKEKGKELELEIKKHINNIKMEDIFENIRYKLGTTILELSKNISIRCESIDYIDNFPYEDEDNQKKYDTLGFFKFYVEYYKDCPDKKETIQPIYLQEIPGILIQFLKDFSEKDKNKYIIYDIESPIYVFVCSDKIENKKLQWNKDNIYKYKKEIGEWVEIYSGHWHDYNDELYETRIKNNLSNRLSELHFIQRNSGFIYMEEDNYKRFFNSYMERYVLIPTIQIRSILFALRLINESLDLLFLKVQSEEFKDIDTIESKISNLRFLRGLIQTNLSVIYGELDCNRRQHYIVVLKYLLEKFEIDNTLNRINNKFEIIYDSMQQLYQNKNEEIQNTTIKGLNYLNALFGAGVLADLGGTIMLAFSMKEEGFKSMALNFVISFMILGILLIALAFNVYAKYKVNKSKFGYAVDAIIEDNRENLVLVKRKYQPFRDFYSLPGGFVKSNESPEKALLREIKEETNLDVKIVKKIGVFKEPGRDPRGNIHSTAYKCVIKDGSNIESGSDSAKVELVPKKESQTTCKTSGLKLPCKG